MKKSISISSKRKIKVFKVNFKKRISLLCTVLITVTSLFAYVPPKAYAADITADARGTEEQEELDKNAYPFMEDTEVATEAPETTTPATETAVPETTEIVPNCFEGGYDILDANGSVIGHIPGEGGTIGE